MNEFLLLVAPTANRVYASDAPRLVAAEARRVLSAFGDVGDCGVRTIAGVDYVVVETEDSERVRAALAHLSAVFAAFEASGDLLRPVELGSAAVYSDDLVTIQKYQGKTNEQWTRLCLNVTAASTRHPQRLLDGSLAVLDPMCGRGTTLNIAMLAGFDAIGVDIDKRDFAAYEMFIKTWLRQHRLKHTIESTTLRHEGVARGHRLHLVTAPDKQRFKAGDTTSITYLETDTTRLEGLLRAGSVDVIVTDTPYGVQHGSHGHGAHSDALSRSPIALLDKAIDGWLRVLRSGGAIGLSVNRHVAGVPELHALLRDHGLDVVDLGDDFRHRVDASIDRDLVVARKV